MNMKARTTVKKALVCAMAVLAATFALAVPAFAADTPEVRGTDFHTTGSAIEAGEVDVLTVAGQTGGTIFVSVAENGTDIAKFIPYTLGEGVTRGSGDNWTGVVTLDISTFDVSKLNGTYTVSAYASRAGGTPIYTGTILGVYADLPGGESKLIGTRTVGAADSADRTFQPNETVYANGRTYRLAGSGQATQAADGTLHFAYEAYDEATTVDGVVKYVDQNGQVVATSKIAGIPYQGTREVKIPSAVEADNGDVYRTVFFRDSVVAENPGKTSFTIACVKMSEAEQTAANFYVATIQLVDENERVIATDTVNVTGVFRYTAPTNIYKTELVDPAYGEQSVVTYNIVGDPVIVLNAATDGITTKTRTIQVPYTTVAPDRPEIDVTFNLIDGTKRANDKDRVLSVQTVKVNTDSPTATPEAQIQVDGKTYVLSGQPENYEYSLRSGKVPIVNAYYVPEGYEPPGVYQVTVDYVNFLTGETVSSASYDSDPALNGNLQIETPATFEANGVEYIRLDGQEEPIAHNYYSGITNYTVYYRDKNDTLTSGTVINTIRVVYADGEEGTVAPGADATQAGDAGDQAGTTTAATDAADVAEALRLNASRTYNVFDGAGNNGTLTNEEGVDSNTERIEDEYNPLASGATDTTGAQNGLFAGMPSWAVPAIAVAAAAIIAVLLFLFASRRKRNAEKNQA